MEFKINSKAHGEIIFHMNDHSGYVTVWNPVIKDCVQICYGGDFLGDTIRSTPGTFERDCRKWHKARLATLREYAGTYFR